MVHTRQQQRLLFANNRFRHGHHFEKKLQVQMGEKKASRGGGIKKLP
jgi:hypothetical protein